VSCRHSSLADRPPPPLCLIPWGISSRSPTVAPAMPLPWYSAPPWPPRVFRRFPFPPPPPRPAPPLSLSLLPIPTSPLCRPLFPPSRSCVLTTSPPAPRVPRRRCPLPPSCDSLCSFLPASSPGLHSSGRRQAFVAQLPRHAMPSLLRVPPPPVLSKRPAPAPCRFASLHPHPWPAWADPFTLVPSRCHLRRPCRPCREVRIFFFFFLFFCSDFPFPDSQRRPRIKSALPRLARPPRRPSDLMTSLVGSAPPLASLCCSMSPRLPFH